MSKGVKGNSASFTLILRISLLVMCLYYSASEKSCIMCCVALEDFVKSEKITSDDITRVVPACAWRLPMETTVLTISGARRLKDTDIHPAGKVQPAAFWKM